MAIPLTQSSEMTPGLPATLPVLDPARIRIPGASTSLGQLAVQEHFHQRGLAQRLIDDAVALGQADQSCKLFRGGVSIEHKFKPDALEAHRRILGNPERSPKIQVAFGMDRTAPQIHANGG